MKATNQKAIETILMKLDEFSNELTAIQEEEQSDALDQALDDLSMVMDELNSAMEE